MAIAVITRIRETTFGQLTDEDWEGHGFSSEAEMYETYSRYYDRPVTRDAPLKIIWFKLV